VKLCVVGVGYVGLVTGTCFAHIGNEVVCVDVDSKKVQKMQRGISPIYEPGLPELMKKNIAEGRLAFTTDIARGIKEAEIIFIAVGTPPRSNGEADLSQVYTVAGSIGEYMDEYKTIVTKSTVPVGTGDRVKELIKEQLFKRGKDIPFDIVSNPEFLREGSAVHDSLNPDRIIIGAENSNAADKLVELHKPFKAPVVVTDIRSAEMIKYASNAFLATKISFINEIANICERVGADVTEVARGMGLDPRIGDKFLNAGVGYGGSCFPKDTRALINMASSVGYDFQIMKAVDNVNKLQRMYVVDKLEKALNGIKGKKIGVLGLSFKPNTDDIREAPSLDIINKLKELGGIIRAYDPAAVYNAKMVLYGVCFCSNPYETAEGCDALLLLTEWEEFSSLDFGKLREIMKGNVIIDGRNLWEPEKVRSYGFIYLSIGR